MAYDATEDLENLKMHVLSLSHKYKDSIPNIENEPLLESSIAFLKMLNPFSASERELIQWCFCVEEDDDLWKSSWTGWQILMSRMNVDTSKGVEDDFQNELHELSKRLGSVSDETQELLGQTLLPLIWEAPTDSKKSAIMIHIFIHFQPEMNLPKCS